MEMDEDRWPKIALYRKSAEGRSWKDREMLVRGL